MRNPEIDLDLNNSNSFFLLVGIGNLTNVCRLVCGELLNPIPYDLVPFRYRMTLLAASICAFVGYDRYFASMFVVVEMSGLVDVDNHVRHPIRYSIFAVKLFCVWQSYSLVYSLSTGRPLR